jgi:hypothetical protein
VIDSFRRRIDTAFPVNVYLGASVCGKTRRVSDASGNFLHVAQMISWKVIEACGVRPTYQDAGSGESN